MRHGIPTTFPASEADPTRSRLTPTDCLELALLTMPDAAFSEYENAKNLDAYARGESTGDARVDDFFDLIAERRRKAAENA